MAASLNLDDVESFKTKIDRKAHDLFKGRPGQAPLQVNRYLKTKIGKEKQTNCFVRNQSVWEDSQIRALEESNDATQIFVIRQQRSWTTLNISRDLFESFLKLYGIFPQFWKFAFAFGRKFEENEFEFPGFRARHTRLSASNLTDSYGS